MNILKRFFGIREEINPVDFNEWYKEFRSEMVRSSGVDYAIAIASYTIKDNHKHYFDKGLSPKQSVVEYLSSRRYN